MQTCERDTPPKKCMGDALGSCSERESAKDATHNTEVIEVILSPSDRYMQTIRKAPSYKPVDNLGVNSDRCWDHAVVARALSLYLLSS